MDSTTPSMRYDFTGKTALVTGGTRGIGRAVAEELAKLGARIILTGTDKKRAEEIARSLAGDGHIGLGVDFNDRASSDRFLEIIASTKKLEILVNNAGINLLNAVQDVRDSDWKSMQEVNLEMPLRLTRAVAPIMTAAGYGRIVNIASIFGVISKGKRALYSMTKFGIRGLTVASALDLANAGVLVNSVSPGFVKTELTDRNLTPSQQADLAAQVPLGRFASPVEVAAVIVFLVSSLNSYVTAQNIVVDGGFISA